jgi:DNA modification methylase
MSELVTRHIGDCIDILPTLDPQSVQAIVTSPPYFGLRDYGLPPTDWPAISYAPMAGLPELDIPAWRGCLGLEPTLEMYTAHLVYVFRLAREVLKDDGVLWLNLGDSYASSGKHATLGKKSGLNNGTLYENSKKQTIPSGRAPTPKGLKPKDLMLVPHRVALALQADGWYLRNDNIWHKPNCMPGSQKDRATRDHEYVFQLTKQARYYFDMDAVRVKAQDRDWKTWEERKALGGFDDGREKTTLDNGQYSLKHGAGFAPVNGGRSLRTVWKIATKPYSEAHFAVMPPPLAELCIKASTKPGDSVLDMFGGSGTTARAAVKLGRKAILIELSEEYGELQAERTTVQTAFI